MKNVLLLLSILSTLLIFGENKNSIFNRKVHLPLKGDIIRKIPVSSPNDSLFRNDSVWNFSSLNRVQKVKPEIHKYDSLYSGDVDSMFILRSPTQQTVFVVDSDSLYAKEYSNNIMKLTYDTLLLTMNYSQSLNDTLKCSFRGKGIYGQRIPLIMVGYSQTYIEGTKELKLPGKEKLDSVFCLINEKLIHETSQILMKTTQRTWYTKEDKYPFFEYNQIDLIENDSVKNHSQMAFLIELDEVAKAREDQRKEEVADSLQAELDKLKEEEELKQQMISDSLANLNNLYPMTECIFYPVPVKTDLQVKFIMEESAKVKFRLHDPNGIQIYQSAERVFEPGKYTEHIPMNRYNIGVYVLFIQVNDIVVQKNIIKS